MKTFFYITVLSFAFISFSGCEKDDSLDPRPVIVDGQFMRLDITRRGIDFADLETDSFGGTLTNPSGTVVRYELFVRLLRGEAFLNEYIPLKTVTTFPFELSITANDIIEAYSAAGIVTDIRNADKFRFIAYSYDINGNKVGFSNLSRTVQAEAAYKQAYRFTSGVENPISDTYNNYEAF
jgi:hypothetical protein